MHKHALATAVLMLAQLILHGCCGTPPPSAPVGEQERTSVRFLTAQDLKALAATEEVPEAIAGRVPPVLGGDLTAVKEFRARLANERPDIISEDANKSPLLAAFAAAFIAEDVLKLFSAELRKTAAEHAAAFDAETSQFRFWTPTMRDDAVVLARQYEGFEFRREFVQKVDVKNGFARSAEKVLEDIIFVFRPESDDPRFMRTIPIFFQDKHPRATLCGDRLTVTIQSNLFVSWANAKGREFTDKVLDDTFVIKNYKRGEVLSTSEQLGHLSGWMSVYKPRDPHDDSVVIGVPVKLTMSIQEVDQSKVADLLKALADLIDNGKSEVIDVVKHEVGYKQATQ